jgi:hypothetical protein
MRRLDMIPCKHFYCLKVEAIDLPETLQRFTKLPGDPQGDAKTGYSYRRRELLLYARQDRDRGGHPVIEKVLAPPRAPYRSCNQLQFQTVTA